MKVAAIAVPLLGAFVIAQQAKLMTPECVMGCTVPWVGLSGWPDWNLACGNSTSQSQLFHCLTTFCPPAGYSSALTTVILGCSAVGATIGTLHPIKLEATTLSRRRLPIVPRPIIYDSSADPGAPATPRNLPDTVGPAGSTMGPVACNAGSDGILTVSIPVPGPSTSPQSPSGEGGPTDERSGNTGSPNSQGDPARSSACGPRACDGLSDPSQDDASETNSSDPSVPSSSCGGRAPGPCPSDDAQPTGSNQQGNSSADDLIPLEEDCGVNNTSENDQNPPTADSDDSTANSGQNEGDTSTSSPDSGSTENGAGSSFPSVLDSSTNEPCPEDESGDAAPPDSGSADNADTANTAPAPYTESPQGGGTDLPPAPDADNSIEPGAENSADSTNGTPAPDTSLPEGDGANTSPPTDANDANEPCAEDDADDAAPDASSMARPTPPNTTDETASSPSGEVLPSSVTSTTTPTGSIDTSIGQSDSAQEGTYSCSGSVDHPRCPNFSSPNDYSENPSECSSNNNDQLAGDGSPTNAPTSNYSPSQVSGGGIYPDTNPVNTGLSGNTSDIESSAPAPDPYGAGNLASAGETGSEGAYQSIPSTSSEGPADSKSTSSSDTDAGCGGSREGSSDVDACEGGTASQPADNTLWPLPGDAPAPSASMTIPETLPTSYVQPSVTFVKAHPPNGWVSPTAWATSEPIIKPSEITIGSGPGETGFPGNGDEGINAKVVSIIAPNGYGGGTTAVITVSGPSDSWASITPSLIGNIPEYTQLDGRVVDPHQGSDYDSETAETTFMKSERVRNDTNDAAPVVVTDRAYKSTPSCIALLECFTIMACLLL